MFELEHSMKIFESFLWKCYIFYLSFSWRFFFFPGRAAMSTTHLLDAINPVCSLPVLQDNSPLD